MPYTIAICNNKGGVGKTTSTLNIGAYLAQKHRVLLIDMDPQANLTTAFKLPPDGPQHVGTWILDETPLEDIRHQKENLHLIPSSNHLRETEIMISSKPGGNKRLRRALKPLKNEYDYILIDCPPSLGLLTVNAFLAADKFLSPFEASYFSYSGIANLLNFRDNLNEFEEHDIEMLGIFLTKFNPRQRSRLSQGMAKKIRDSQISAKVFDTTIRTNKDLGESPILGMDVYEYAPESNGAQDYQALTQEIIEAL